MKSGVKDAAAAAGVTDSVPRWQSTQYSVLLTRENGQWRIKNMSVARVIDDE